MYMRTLTLVAATILAVAVAACSSGDVNEPVPLETATTSPSPAMTSTPFATGTAIPSATATTTSPATAAASSTAAAGTMATGGSADIQVTGLFERVLPEGTADVVESIHFDLADGSIGLRTAITSKPLAEQLCSFVSGRVLFFTRDVEIQDSSGETLATCTLDQVTGVDFDVATNEVVIGTTWTDADQDAADELCSAIADTVLAHANVTVQADDGSELTTCTP